MDSIQSIGSFSGFIGPIKFYFQKINLPVEKSLDSFFNMSVNLINIYQILQSRYPHMSGWPDGQWPVSGKFESDLLEIVVGAVLAQNTRWSNVEMALQGLVKEELVDTISIDSCSTEELERAIRSSGFYRQKAVYLKKVIRLILECPDFPQKIGREKLLATKGIGPETADTILLYACHRHSENFFSVWIAERKGKLSGNSRTLPEALAIGYCFVSKVSCFGCRAC